jgi:hypothetical protein
LKTPLAKRFGRTVRGRNIKAMKVLKEIRECEESVGGEVVE